MADTTVPIELVVETRREGVLQRVGHDLALRVGAAAMTVSRGDDGRVRGLEVRVQAASVSVRAALHGDGREDAGALSARDKAQVDAAIRDDVLEVRRWPEIVFRAETIERPEAARAVLRGTLALHGATLALVVEARRDGGGTWSARATVHQPDFGIKPFKAFLGALKVTPDVVVRATVPASVEA